MFEVAYIDVRPLESVVISPFKLSSNAITFDMVNRSNYRLIIPGSRTANTVSSFVVFKDEQSMLDELPNYGNSFIVDKYTNIFYERLDCLIKEKSFLEGLTSLLKVDITVTDAFIALAVQRPYGLQALSGGIEELSPSGYKIKVREIEGKSTSVDYFSLKNYTDFEFLFKCETSKLLTHVIEEDEKVFSLSSLLESCSYQLMYLTKECALGCYFCQKGVYNDNPPPAS